MKTIKKTRIMIAAFALFLLLPLSAHAVPMLYGVSLNGFSSGYAGPSSLYAVDSTTGAGTLIGNLGYAVNSIASDPTTGIMYGATTSWSGFFNGLLEIDPTTGAATEIGSFGGAFESILGLTFNSSGELFGWHGWHAPNADDPVRIDIMTGAATTVGNSGVDTGGLVLAFDNADGLTMVTGKTVSYVDTITGAAYFGGILAHDPGSGGADFHPTTGALWASATSGQEDYSWIRVSNIADNSYVDIDTDISYLHALTFAEPIPEPATMLLIGSGLISLFVFRMKFRKA